MGFLSDLGKTLSYNESKDIQDLIKKYGIDQFIKLLKKYQHKTIKL